MPSGSRAEDPDGTDKMLIHKFGTLPSFINATILGLVFGSQAL
jgi:hypothetical protein